jgi:hypothetical protein
VRAAQGRGTFVEAPRLAYPIGRRTRFSEIVSQAGRERHPVGEVAGEQFEDRRARGDVQGLCGGGIGRHRGGGQHADLGSITRAYAAHGVADYSRLATRIGARPAAADEAARRRRTLPMASRLDHQFDPVGHEQAAGRLDASAAGASRNPPICTSPEALALRTGS